MSHYDPEIKQGAAEAAKQIISYINAGGMIIGIIAANLADVIFGGIMLGMLFRDIDIIIGPPVDGWVLGFIVSFAFWFVQNLMWQRIFEDGEITTADVMPLILALVVALVDTNIDVAPAFLWIETSTIASSLRTIELFGSITLYDLTLSSAMVGLYLVNGCSELFNAWYFSKINTKRTQPKRVKPKQQSQSRIEHLRRQQAAAAQQGK